MSRSTTRGEHRLTWIIRRVHAAFLHIREELVDAVVVMRSLGSGRDGGFASEDLPGGERLVGHEHVVSGMVRMDGRMT